MLSCNIGNYLIKPQNERYIIIQIIKYVRKLLLFGNTSVWVKNDGNPLSDVTMGNFDGVKVCELVGLHLLNKISIPIDSHNVGAVISKANVNGPMLDKLRKHVIATFKNKGLSVTNETNLAETGFLDVTFNLSTGTCYPYNKLKNTPL